MSEKLDATRIDAALERAAKKSVHGTRGDRSGRFMAPRAFISYSHDSPEHKSWVLKLGSDLRAIGVDIVLDQWDLAPGQDVSLFMQKGISEADHVVLVCSSAYVSKSEKGVGGVGYERLIVTAEVVQSIDTRKFIPILRGSDPTRRVPVFLGPRMYVDFEHDGDYDAKLVELARAIHDAPAESKPALGPNPFSSKPIALRVSGSASPTEAETPYENSLSNSWFLQERTRAQDLISKINLTGYMELRANVSHSLSKSQIELLNAVKLSEIRTFGWPIGVTLENREGCRPRPYKDGIKAEISIAEGDRKSFDYWAARSNGDFYLLQSLFEDSRKPNQIFFDTRVVRVTECLMFIEGLYSKLGVPPEARVGIQITHGGLKGRELSSASSNRHIFSHGPAEENESVSEITTILGTMGETRVDDVRKIVEPMFMLFNFMQFNASVYEDIVRNFERGIIR
jgi:TIR domain-containing protein